MKSISFEIEANVKILTDKTDRQTDRQTDTERTSIGLNCVKRKHLYWSISFNPNEGRKRARP